MINLIADPIPTIDSDPETGQPWPTWFDTTLSARYLTERHGLPTAPQTLAHQRSNGRGIRWKYRGQKPVTTRAELDRHATEDALQDESPLTRRARERRAAAELAKRQATQQPPKRTEQTAGQQRRVASQHGGRRSVIEGVASNT